ncbi:MAG: SDR family NAD(P)-dependent oxidoreductase [Thermoplasmata archaeon]
MTLSKKVYLVAGVGGGLGTALVCLLASEGATVAGVARGSEALERVAAHARERGWHVATRVANLMDGAAVARMVAGVREEFGRLDGVSVNVGHWIGGEALLHRMSDAEWTDAMRDNLDPVFRVVRAALPVLIGDGGGSLVLVSAAPAVRAAASASYAAAKVAVAALVPKLAHDYRPLGVRVNAVLPGSMANQLDGLDPPAPDHRIPLTDTTATGPWEVARAIRYLLSEESRWMTGALLLVDGGASTGAAPGGSRPP